MAGVDTERTGLFGSGELVTPSWAEGYERMAQARTWLIARAAPRSVRVLVGMAWRTSPPLTVAVFGVNLVAAAATTLGLLATADVFAQLLAEGPTPARLVGALPAMGLVAAAAVGRGLLQAAAGALEAELVPRIDRRAADELYAGLAGIDLLAFDDPDFTDLVSRAEYRGVQSIHRGLNVVADLLASAVSVLAAVVAVSVLYPALGPLVLVVALPQAWATMRGAQLEMASFVRRNGRERRLYIVGDLLSERSAATEVRACTAEQALLREHRRLADDLAAEALTLGRRQNLLATAGRALAAAGVGVCLLTLGLLIYIGGLPLALAGTAVVALRTANTAVISGVYGVSQLFELGIYVQLYHDCLAEIERRRRPDTGRAVIADPAHIELADVSFRYPDQERPALDGVTLSLRAGQVVALVGENGSGKSTLAKLITGLYLPTSGEVRWDGVPTAEFEPGDLHSRCALVLQEPLRWPLTAGNNIRIGRHERLDSDGAVLAAAAARAGADIVLTELPDGEETVLSKQFRGGQDLSGGQWQRISVARGLYRDAAVVVADEPTSSMDARAEHAVFRALRELSTPGADRRLRLTVLITHRLANVRHADSIVVLDNGRITEQGTHDELMARSGTYRELFSLQAHAYR